MTAESEETETVSDADMGRFSMLLSWVWGVSWASWAMGISGRRE
jgi:hypothetical protein